MKPDNKPAKSFADDLQDSLAEAVAHTNGQDVGAVVHEIPVTPEPPLEGGSSA